MKPKKPAKARPEQSIEDMEFEAAIAASREAHAALEAARRATPGTGAVIDPPATGSQAWKEIWHASDGDGYGVPPSVLRRNSVR